MSKEVWSVKRYSIVVLWGTVSPSPAPTFSQKNTALLESGVPWFTRYLQQVELHPLQFEQSAAAGAGVVLPAAAMANAATIASATMKVRMVLTSSPVVA